MLKWYNSKENTNRWEGYEDDTLLYTVTFDDVDAWEWIYLPDGYGFHGYDLEEEAMEAAEVDYKNNHQPTADEEEPDYTLEELDEILGDILYEEARDEGWLK